VVPDRKPAIDASDPGQRHAGHENPARIAVVRVKRLAVPRLDIKPAPPPCRGRRLQISAAARRRSAFPDDHEVNDDNDGVHLEAFRHKLTAPGFGCTRACGFPEVARCYTIGRGIVTNRSRGDNCRSSGKLSGLEVTAISPIIDKWIL
jgi:hypothetical protein